MPLPFPATRSLLLQQTTGSIDRSVDKGNSWLLTCDSLSYTTSNIVKEFVSIAGALYAQTEKAILFSPDTGLTWIDISPIENSGGGDAPQYSSLARYRGEPLATSRQGIHLFNYYTTSWDTMNTGLARESTLGGIFGDEKTIIATLETSSGASGGKVKLSTDHGDHWREIWSSTRNRITAAIVYDSTIILGDDSAWIHLSIDKGDSWQTVRPPRLVDFDGDSATRDSAIIDMEIAGFTASPTVLFAETRGHYQGINYLYRSHDTGVTWELIREFSTAERNRGDLEVVDSTLFKIIRHGTKHPQYSLCAAAQWGDLWATTRDSLLPFYLETGINGGASLTADGTTLLYCTQYTTLDNTASVNIVRGHSGTPAWEPVFHYDSLMHIYQIFDLKKGVVFGFASINQSSSRFVVSADTGATWGVVDLAIDDYTEHETGIIQDSRYLYYREPKTLFRVPISELLESAGVATLPQFEQAQSKPALTVSSIPSALRCSWTLPTAMPVSFSLRTLQGREVFALDKGIMETGTHQLSLPTESLASGCYILSMQAGMLLTTRSCVLYR